MNEPGQLALSDQGNRTQLRVRVIPRASKTGLDGVTDDGALRVRLSAPPVDGAANAALVAFLADVLDMPKRNIAVIRGARSRDKVVAISAPPARVRDCLAAARALSPRGSTPAKDRA